MMRKRGLVLSCLAIASTLAVGLMASSAQAAADDPGQVAFLANKCNLCHSVSTAGIVATTKSEKMKGPDLKGVVAKLGIERAKLWVTKQAEKDGKKHAKEYKGTPEDLDKILAWLAAQK